MGACSPENVPKEFFSNFLADRLEDWVPARAIGEFIVSSCPTLLVGHLVLCRALRHLGDPERAVEELNLCITIANGVGFFEQGLLPELKQEQQTLMMKTGETFPTNPKRPDAAK